MPSTQNGANYTDPDRNDGDNSREVASVSVGSRERENEVLSLLEELGTPLPPMAIFRALKVKRKITFEYRTVQDILRRLLDDGYVMRCDKGALDEGRIEPIPDTEADRRTYYYITDEGRERLESA